MGVPVCGQCSSSAFAAADASGFIFHFITNNCLLNISADLLLVKPVVSLERRDLCKIRK
jgi:hypothetical protein